MTVRSIVFVAALAALLYAQSGEVVVVELRDGKRLPGRLVEPECTDESCVVRLLRTEKKLVIPWGDIKEELARDLRIKLGFEVAEASAGLYVKGVRIRNRAGTQFIGKLTNADTAEKDRVYVLKTSDGTRRIPFEDVREGPEELDVDALAIYTPQELYTQRLAEKEPVSAEDHFRLAEFAQTIGAYEPAREHYLKVIELADPKYPESLVQRLLERVNRAIDSREAVAALREIRKQIVFKNFAKATELVAAFRTTYADDEDLLEECAGLEKTLEQERTDYYVVIVSRALRDDIRDLLAEKVKEKDENGDPISLRKAMQYAGGDPTASESVASEAVAMIAEKQGLEPEEVLKFWEQRPKSGYQTAFFRDGTFIVIDNLQDALARAPKPKLDPKGPKPPKAHPQITPDDWWKGKVEARRNADLRDFLFAWWAQESGMVELLEPKDETCPACAGKGYTQQMVVTPQGSVPFFDRCSNCHMATFFRVVRYR